MPRLKLVTYRSNDVGKALEFYSTVLGATGIEDKRPQ